MKTYFLYIKDVDKVIPAQLTICNDNEVIIRPCSYDEQNRDFVTYEIHPNIFAELTLSIISHITSSGSSKIQWNRRRDTIPKSFKGMV